MPQQKFLIKQLKKSLFNCLIGLGILNLLIIPVDGVPKSQNNHSFPNYCRARESLFIVAETKGFWVNICGGDLPHTYIGVSKINGNKIRLPLREYDRQGQYFEAVNKDVSYLLIRGSTKGDFLTVTKGERELFRQPVINWHEESE